MAFRGCSSDGNLWTVQKAGMLLAAVALVFSNTARADSLCEVLIFPLGYACNEYTVETEDGFLLGMYNIPYGRAGPTEATPGPPVLLFHGFQAGGDNFVSNSAEESLGTVLADAGYDVWIANNRDIAWSHGSTRYSYSDEGYWDWTWDELAAYDVPVSINFVYNQRGGTKIFYVGHSQGCLILFAALTNPAPWAQNTIATMKSQLRATVLIAPFAYNANVEAPLNKLLVTTYADEILPILGIGPVDVNKLTNVVCSAGQAVCLDLIEGFVGLNNYFNQTRRFLYLQFFPELTSSKNLNHFGQTKRSGLFQKYDRGPIENMMKYGQVIPPTYSLSNFPADLPVQILRGGTDQLADPIDSLRTISELPSTDKEVITFPDYGHVDFVFGYRAYLDIYPHLISFLNRH